MEDQQRLINQVRRGLAKADTSRRNPYQKELIRPFPHMLDTSGREKECLILLFFSCIFLQRKHASDMTHF